MNPIKNRIKPTAKKIGLWGVPLAVHRSTQWVQRVCYSAAGSLGLGFAVQLRFLPPQFLEQPIFVSPSNINYATTGPHPPGLSPVLDGDWDLPPELLKNDVGNWGFHFRLIHEMFVEHKPYHQTSQFKEMEQELRDRGETVNHKFRSMEEILEYIKKYEPIFNDIKENGYKTQGELGNPLSAYEIRVGISRDGEVLFLGQGNHRLAMAKILDLQCVPVSVWTVHKLWARRCFKKYGGGLLDAVYKGLDDIDYYRNRGETRQRGETLQGLATSPNPEPTPELEMTGDPVERSSRDCQIVDTKAP